MDNWNFTGKPDVPAWPKDAQGQDEKAVLLTQTFDSPADTDMIISLLAAYGIPCFKYYAPAIWYCITAFPASGPSLYVPEAQLEEAKDLLASRPVEDEETEEHA